MDSDSYSATDLKLQATSPTSEDPQCAEDQETMKKRTFDLLKSGETEIELREQFKKVVLILGDTGNGKSKFTQWIAGDNAKLIARETEEGTDEYIIEDINEMGRSVITSDTIHPHLVVDSETNVAIYDCPGFNDTRDASNEIATTYFIKKVVDHAESVKLIFAINYPSVRKGVDRHNFMKLVKHVADFIKNIEKFRNSIVLVVTKVDNLYVKQGKDLTLVDSNKIIAAVANFLKEVQQDLEVKLQDGSSKERKLHEAAVKFISILLDREGEQYGRIGIFRRPDEPGPVSEISLLQEGKKHIKALIHEKLEFSEKEYNDFGYTVSEKCKNKIHYLVEDININVWSSLSRVKDEMKEYYAKIVNLVQSTIQSFVDETSPSEDLQVKELSTHFRDGCCSIFGLVEDVRNVTNPEDLVQKINAVISNLNIEISKNDLLDIENNGKYFNFLQVVSDRELSIRPWDELIREVYVYLSYASNKLQENIDVVASEICNQIESDLQQIAKALQDQFDEKMKLFDMKEAVEILTNYHDAMLKMTKKIKEATSITELLKIVRDVTRDMNINLPEHNALNAIQKEENFAFLKAISETEVNFVLSAWTHPFESIVKHLNESKMWYRFLDGLYVALSDYKIQKNKEKYNVLDIEDWGKTGKPQGIAVTKNNFAQFLRSIAKCKSVEYADGVKNITLTELRLEELNQLLNLTLKHRIDIQRSQPSIFVRAEYIRTKEIAHQLENNFDNGCTLLAALKSGVYKYLHIFALRKVFIDENISLPGTELRIVSPEWEIIGTRKINLDGADGEPHSDIKAADAVFDGCNGEKGKPGLPGKFGGNFFGTGASFVNGTNLTVTVDGGTGGPGQHGGNGGKGEDGKDVGHLANGDLPKCDEDNITRIKGFVCERTEYWSSFSVPVILARSVFISKSENEIFKIIGSPGKPGGNGGDGGKGGKGGNHGNVLMFELNNDSEITISKVKGKDGANGSGGKGGKGGKDGKTTIATRNGVMNSEWKSQIKKPAGAASDGQTGTSGLNSTGLKAPESSNAISEPFKIINKYKMYAEQHLICRFKKVLLLDFITLLNDIDEIQN